MQTLCRFQSEFVMISLCSILVLCLRIKFHVNVSFTTRYDDEMFIRLLGQILFKNTKYFVTFLGKL